MGSAVIGRIQHRIEPFAGIVPRMLDRAAHWWIVVRQKISKYGPKVNNAGCQAKFRNIAGIFRLWDYPRGTLTDVD